MSTYCARRVYLRWFWLNAAFLVIDETKYANSTYLWVSKLFATTTSHLIQSIVHECICTHWCWGFGVLYNKTFLCAKKTAIKNEELSSTCAVNGSVKQFNYILLNNSQTLETQNIINYEMLLILNSSLTPAW